MSSALVVVAGAAFTRWRPFRVEVVGGSMRPALDAGEWAVAIRATGARAGDVVVVEHPARPGFELVKRVVEVVADGLWIEGDAGVASTDSRTFGLVPRERLVGRVVLVYHPWRRLRLIRRSS